MRDFEKIGFFSELDSGLETRIYERDEVMALFNLKSDEDLSYLINRTEKYCKGVGAKTVFNKFVKVVREEFEHTTKEGLLLMCLAWHEDNSALIAELQEDIAWRLMKFYAKSKRSKGGNRQKRPDLEAEDIMEFKAQKIGSDLKTPNFDIEDKSHFFYGKKVVLTGNFEHFPVRSKMAEWIKEVGGDNNGSISKKTDIVIVGESAGWKKLEQIEKFGTKTMTESEFLNLFPHKKQ